MLKNCDLAIKVDPIQSCYDLGCYGSDYADPMFEGCDYDVIGNKYKN